MPINAGPEYGAAERRYHQAKIKEERLKALREMLVYAPKHKSSESLLANIKERIAKLKGEIEKQAKIGKSKGKQSFSIKREGAAQVVLVGVVETEKDIILKELTNAKPSYSSIPDIGVMDYYGVKIQIVNMPVVYKGFKDSEHGPSNLSIIKQADLMVLFFNTAEEKKILDLELDEVGTPFLIFNNQENLKDEVWIRLGVIKVYTKQPGQPKQEPPIALKKGATVRVLAERIHKDFVKNFKYARVWGKSVKHKGAQEGLAHVLEDDDVVEIHVK